MHSAINRLDDTTTIAPRPPSSLTTELEPLIQSPRNTQSQITSKLHSATNRFDDTTTIAPRPPSSLTTELEPLIQSPRTRNHNSAAASTVPTTVLTTPPRMHTGAPNSDNPCDTTKQLQTIRGSSLGTDPLTATCQHMQVDTYELLQTDRQAAGHPQGNVSKPEEECENLTQPNPNVDLVGLENNFTLYLDTLPNAPTMRLTYLRHSRQ